MKITRDLTALTESLSSVQLTVDELTPEARDTMRAIRTAADTITVVATVVAVAVLVGVLVNSLGGNRVQPF